MIEPQKTSDKKPLQIAHIYGDGNCGLSAIVIAMVIMILNGKLDASEHEEKQKFIIDLF